MTGVLPRNMVPGRYRGVSVTHVDVPLDEAALREFFVGRNAYFKTRFVVARRASETAVLAVSRAPGDGLFSAVSDVTMLARPEQTTFLDAPDVDTGIPSELARVARAEAPDRLAVVVHGRYEHVNFIIGADPLRIVVREVVPPAPAKLYDQAQRILKVREDLPPIELVPDVVDLAHVARANPAEDYLLPCRGSGFVSAEATVHYLDEHPERADWTLLGCERSRQIHRAFYGNDAPTVDICPFDRAVTGETILTKCCLQDDEIRTGDDWVSVPWGSSLQRVSEALDELVRLKEAEWRPA
jgi:hypothetical protein